MSTELTQLTEDERAELATLEATIEHGLQTFIDVGHALLQIREMRLYRETHGTFEDYCRDRWDIDRTYAHRLIKAAEVTETLRVTGTPMLPIGNIGTGGPVLPTNEAQTRPLTKLSDPELQRAAWIHAVKSAPDGRVTAAHVESVVREMLPPEPPKEPKPKPAPVPAAEAVIDGVAEHIDETPPVPTEPRHHPPDAATAVESGTGGVTLPPDPPGPRPTKVEVGEMPNQLVFTRLKSGKIRVDTFYNAEMEPQLIINALAQMLGRGEMMAMIFKSDPAPGDEFQPGEPRLNMTPSSAEEPAEAEPVSSQAQGADEGVTLPDSDNGHELEYEPVDDGHPDDVTPDIEIPDVFPTPQHAWRWAVQLGAFASVPQARTIYMDLKAKHKPARAADMARLWINHCAQWLPELQDALAEAA